MTKREIPFRYAWNHQGRLHRATMRLANSAIGFVPDRVKYGVGHRIRRSKLPYNLLDGLVAVQVGAPYDTLKAGRSRAAYFGLSVGAKGHLIAIEPLESSVEQFRDFAAKNLECRTDVLQSAVWSEPGTLELHVDERHPATNYSDGTVNYSADRAADYDVVTVRKETLDVLLAELGVEPDLVSITTNWAEEEILAGMSGLIAGGLRYICLALGEDREDYRDVMTGLGYQLLGFDDRGATYERS